MPYEEQRSRYSLIYGGFHRYRHSGVIDLVPWDTCRNPTVVFDGRSQKMQRCLWGGRGDFKARLVILQVDDDIPLPDQGHVGF